MQFWKTKINKHKRMEGRVYLHWKLIFWLIYCIILMQYHRKPCHRYIWWLYSIFIQFHGVHHSTLLWPVVVKWIKVQHKGLLGKFSFLSKYTLSLLLIVLNFGNFGSNYQRVSFTYLFLSHRLVVKVTIMFIAVSVNCAEQAATSAGETC